MGTAGGGDVSGNSIFGDVLKTHSNLIPGPAFYAGALLLSLVLLHLATMMLARTDGVLVYCLDDTYIHLAIAHTLQTAGIYGVVPDAVNFASSSILWPILLAVAGAIGGALELQPLILNALAAIGSLWLIDAMGKREGLTAPGRFMVMFFFLIGAPVPSLVYVGLEHVLHIFSVLLIIYLFLGGRQPAPAARSVGIGIYLAVAAAVLVRYESLAVAGVVAVAYVLDREWKKAAAILVSAVVPVVLVGFVMIGYGGFFLPNSLMIKGPTFHPTFLENFHTFLYYHLIWPANGNDGWRLLYVIQIVAVTLLLLPRDEGARRFRSLLQSWPLLVIFQILFIRHDQFVRYSPYIVGPTLVIGLTAFMKSIQLESVMRDRMWTSSRGVSLTLIGVILLFPLVHHGMQTSRKVPQASQNIYDQQYQMAEFLSRNYRGASVAVNDLGLPSFRGGVRPVDLVGLADTRIADARLRNTFNTDSIRTIARERKVELAVVYDFWLIPPFAIPPEWEKVQRWVIPDNIICGGDTVTFWAVRAGSADSLRNRLHRFQSSLPKRVSVINEERK